jgi:ATP-dependent DNA helicase RecG
MSENELIKIVDELRALPKEKEWFEFKHNKQLPNKEIGEYISAISNSACLCDQPSGYLIWGIENNTHKVVGTSFNIS